MINNDNSYRYFGFKAPKGTYALVSTYSEGKDPIDEFKCLETQEFKSWPRASIATWAKQGKITPVKEATHMLWYCESKNKL